MTYKRGRIYWYKFVWQGETIRESTHQTNDKVARQMEAAHKTALAKGEAGFREKRSVPTLAEFTRPIPMTPRARKTLETLWQSQGRPSEGWVWPAPTRSGHIENSGIRDQHSEAFRALEKNLTPVRPFVLHELRHTFLTRLGMTGIDLWNFMRIAGHSSPAVSARYVHAQESTILVAMERLESLPVVEPKNSLPLLPA